MNQEEKLGSTQEQKLCERCGKPITSKYGSGRFCSKYCAHSRIQTAEIRAKKSKAASGKKYYSNGIKTIVLRPDEDIPAGYINFNLRNSKYSSTDEKLEAEVKHSIRVRNKISRNFLLKKYANYIAEHNKEILLKYRAMMADLIASKKDSFQLKNIISYYSKYPAVYMPEHARSYPNGLVFVHVLLGEFLLGRSLTSDEIVHHCDENKENNSIDNIFIFDTKSSHSRFHQSKYYWLRINGDVLHCDKVDISKLAELENKEH